MDAHVPQCAGLGGLACSDVPRPNEFGPTWELPRGWVCSAAYAVIRMFSPDPKEAP
jgi:hypothetical protein